MFKNRFLIVLGLLSTLLVATAVSRPFLNVQESPRSVMIPLTDANYFSDYFQRHPELSTSAGTAVDMTDYFVRHPELRTPIDSTDLSDYFLRH